LDAPANELSVRTDPVGGAVASSVKENPDHGPLGHSRLILLIHGYNNTQDAASKSYSSFLQNFRDAWPGRIDLLNDMFKFFWPGDKNWGPASFASFPLEIGPAKESAARLTSYLANLVGPNGTHVDLYFVAHSLGNRMLLEMLTLFSGGSRNSLIQMRGMCLMAAAVPVAMVRSGGRLSGAAQLARSSTLFSPDDKVLHFAFPLGETLAFEGFFPRAVGRFGEPPNLWTNAQPMNRYDHGSYWPTPDTVGPVGTLLGATRDNQIQAAAISAHSLPNPPSVSGAQIAGNTTPTRPPLG
jgi:hypothetical protein